MFAKIVVLGSTGSIGTQTLDVVKLSINKYQIIGLSTNTNIDLLSQQADEFKVKDLAVFDVTKANELRQARPDFNVYEGINGLIKLATLPKAKTIVNALVGKVGVEPTIEAIKQGKDIALANKETLVVQGIKIMQLAKAYKVKIRPIDSEHSAIAQALLAGKKSEIKQIWLTCSGGPFRNATKWPISALKKVSVEQALKHPTWRMGQKISIDSATLANKGLELIEAVRLFDVSPEQIKVVIHPQSIVHSAVEFIDGSIIAEMGATDMRRCIAYALSGQKRIDLKLKNLSLFDVKLDFFSPDKDRFPCLQLAEQALQIGESACAVFSNSNEEAVQKFLKQEIGFMDIPKYIANQIRLLDKHCF